MAKLRDLAAGISIAGVLLPEAIAYAGIAGLHPARAIFAGIAGCLVYPLIGRSRFGIAAPTSSSAAILAAALITLPGDAATKSLLASVAVLLVALLFGLAALLRLGTLTSFISRPVLRGFSFGIAITIVIKQLPLIVGHDLHTGSVAELFWSLLIILPSWNLLSCLLGLAALLLLFGLRRWPTIPGAAIVLILGILISRMWNFPAHDIATIGTIDMQISWPTLQMIDSSAMSTLARLVLPLTLILFAESWGTMRTLALRHNDALEPNRELGALSVANLASGLVQGMPVGTGFSASAANEAIGAQSRFASIFAAIGLAALLYFGAAWIAWLPDAVLAAIVIVAVSHALDPAPLLRLWRLGRDEYVALSAAAGVLIFGVLNGMLLAIALSLIALLKRIATPQLAELARLPDSHDFVDASRHADATRPDGIAIWRPAEPLFFANAERVLAQVETRLRQRSNVHGLVLSLEQSFDLDSTALDALLEFAQRLAVEHIDLQLARVHDHVRDLLKAAHAEDLLTRSWYSVDDAVNAIGGRQ
jgi:MFS superfamily sulfate permease-like transporter